MSPASTAAGGRPHLSPTQPDTDPAGAAQLRPPVGHHGITLDDRLFLLVHKHPIRGPQVVRFLQHLLRHIPGKLLVIWDGAPIRHGQAVQAFVASRAAARLQLEILPGYAPDLNPDEGILNYLKRVELRNRCCATLRQLRYTLRLATARLRHKRFIIHSCFHQAGYRV